MANPWSAFYWSDYDSKTAHLTMVEDGAYRRLLSHYYRTGKPLPANAEILLRVCRAFDDSEKAAVTAVLAEFFTIESDGYHNKRTDQELLKANQVSEKRRDAGKKGADVTNSKKSANAEILPNHLPTQPQPQLQPHKKTRSKAKAGASAFVLPDWIDEKVWADFEEMRQKIGKKLTDGARQRIVDKLDGWRTGGHTPDLILGTSIENGWAGVWQPKSLFGGNGNGTNKAEQRQANNLRACDEAKRMLRMGGGAIDITRGSSRGEPDASTLDDERPEPF